MVNGKKRSLAIFVTTIILMLAMLAFIAYGNAVKFPTWFLLVILIMWPLPTVIAWRTQSQLRWVVAVMNFFIGWNFYGWGATLAVALIPRITWFDDQP